ncbi:hypothetical protein CALVIDRAFT_568855 [Calocera viscosa TUFC12733]|uniref:Uncharacterized protein n=1 Tax=Calocera viscosa (strain TUFC12733) TaxID=1330018 RepID=A0A167GM71_CALVF|nr:hypothetical protein CALVIDRAFT_568855 [Calocera viscosa TUFC12733]
MGIIFNNVVGFSLFGLGVRLWQLGLVHRPLFKPNELWTHASYMVGFGALGYGVVNLEERVSYRLQELRILRREARAKRAEREAAVFARVGLPEDRKEALAIWQKELENPALLTERAQGMLKKEKDAEA